MRRAIRWSLESLVGALVALLVAFAALGGFEASNVLVPAPPRIAPPRLIPADDDG